MSEMQILFNVAVAIAGAFGGWILNNISRAIERLDKETRDIPHTYVKKDDYKDDIKHIRVTLDRIFDLIGDLHQSKADK